MVRDATGRSCRTATSMLVSSFTTTTKSLLLLLLSVSTMMNGCANASCLSSEASILLRIKGDLHLFNGRLSSWDALNGSDCCMWEGVDCDPHTGHIIGLQLRATTTTKSTLHVFKDDMQYAGSIYYPIDPSDELDSILNKRHVDPRDIAGSRIPPALFELHQLQRLDLSGCDFNGSTIPLELAQLTHLTHLNLSRAWFSGCVPNELSSLSDLVSLDLSYISHLYFDVPSHRFDHVLYSWSNLDLIRELELHDLEGFVNNFEHLEYLHLDHVCIKLINSQMWSINLSKAMPNLRSLSLVNCDLEGSLSPHIFKLTYLQDLDLSYNLDLNGKLMPSFFPPQSKLQSLRLARTSLSGRLPSEIFELPFLMVLDMTDNFGLSGPLPARLPKSNLQILKLGHVNLACELPAWICNLTSLVELDLFDTDLSGGFPISIGNLGCLTSLDLSFTKLSGHLPVTIGNLKALTHLHLGWMAGISGSLPITIGNLTALTQLDLSHTSISSDLPVTMANLTALTDLDLAGTNLSSGLPITIIRSLPALSYLDLSFCMISRMDSSFLVNLTQLTFLDLSANMISGSLPSLPQYISIILLRGNNFSGPIPNSYNLFKIKALDLSHNSLTGTLPSNLTYGSSPMQSPLQCLDLSHNKFDGYLNLEIFANFKNLKFLSLSGNNLTVDVHNPTLKFPNLLKLGLASCNINQFPQFLHRHKPIHTLDLSKNMISGEIPKWLSISRSLKIQHNMVTGIEQGFTLDPKVEEVDLSYNMLNSSFKSLFHGTSSFGNMDYFSISNNSVTGEIPALICNFTRLSVLDLSNNKLSGQLPECLFNLTFIAVKLQYNQLQGQLPEFYYYTGMRLGMLDLSHNRFVGNIPTSLGRSKNLEFINLEHNQLSGKFPSWLGKLPKLKALVLRSNFLSGTVNFTFGRDDFQELLMLDISTNQFTGKLSVGLLISLNAMKTFNPESVIPFGFSDYGFDKQWEVTMNIKGTKLTYGREMHSIMKTIDLSNNYFEGGIPEEIRGLSGLQALRISNNKLKGLIPKSIGALKHLESLDLSHNYLSGEIPEELATLNFLEYLNLSYNNFSGRIPQPPHFSTFDALSFEGNPNLCGPPLSLPCEANNSATWTPSVGLRQVDDERMWKYISIGLGFGVGFGTAISFSFSLDNWRDFRRFQRRRGQSYI